jgi:hypothetical protein
LQGLPSRKIANSGLSSLQTLPPFAETIKETPSLQNFAAPIGQFMQTFCRSPVAKLARLTPARVTLAQTLEEGIPWDTVRYMTAGKPILKPFG